MRRSQQAKPTHNKIPGLFQILSSLIAMLLMSSLAVGCSFATPEQLEEKRTTAADFSNRVFIGPNVIAAIDENQKVHTTGLKEKAAAQVSTWEDIVQFVAPAKDIAVGLKADGTVVWTSEDDVPWLDLSDWTDIKQIARGTKRIYGVRSDGTVLAAGAYSENGQLDVEEWRDVVEVCSTTNSSVTYARTSDGKVLCTQGEDQETLGSWTDVVDLKFSRGWILALRSDGTVYSDDYDEEQAAEIAEWEGIVQVAAAGEYGLAAGLKADGTVVFTGYPDESGKGYDEPSFAEIAQWKDVAAIAGYNSYLLGLTNDGRVLFAGRNGSTRNSAYNTSGYRDVVAIFSGDPSFVALKADGTLEGYVNSPISDFPPLW